MSGEQAGDDRALADFAIWIGTCPNCGAERRFTAATKDEQDCTRCRPKLLTAEEWKAVGEGFAAYRAPQEPFDPSPAASTLRSPEGVEPAGETT